MLASGKKVRCSSTTRSRIASKSPSSETCGPTDICRPTHGAVKLAMDGSKDNGSKGEEGLSLSHTVFLSNTHTHSPPLGPYSRTMPRAHNTKHHAAPRRILAVQG